MKELKVVEWNINNRSGVNGSYEWFDLVLKYLIPKQQPDVFILTEYLNDRQLESENVKSIYENFKCELKKSYYFCEHIGDSKKKEQGILICLSQSIFVEPTDIHYELTKLSWEKSFKSKELEEAKRKVIDDHDILCLLSSCITDGLIRVIKEEKEVDREKTYKIDVSEFIDYITPNFLHVRAKTKDDVVVNVIGMRITMAKISDIKDNINGKRVVKYEGETTEPEIFIRRKIQLYRVLNYIKDNKLSNIILMGDFNNGDHNCNGDEKRKQLLQYSYNKIHKAVENFGLNLKTTVQDHSNAGYDYSWYKRLSNGGEWKFKEDHIITDSKHNSHPKYDWDFCDECEAYKPYEKAKLSFNCPLPDHAILEATIKLNDTEEV